MIFASWEIDYTLAGGTQNTEDELTFDIDFRSLYQINPEHKVVLGFCGVNGYAKDAGNTNINSWPARARLIGSFNETSNVLNVPNPLIAGLVVTPFPGIVFGEDSPFYPPKDSRILMPANFQIALQLGSFSQGAVGDFVHFSLTIGYEIELNGKRW